MISPKILFLVCNKLSIGSSKFTKQVWYLLLNTKCNDFVSCTVVSPFAVSDSKGRVCYDNSCSVRYELNVFDMS